MLSRPLLRCLLLLCATATPLRAAGPEPGPPPAPPADSAGRGALRIAEESLRREIEVLARASRHFSRGLDSLSAASFPVIVMTMDEYARRFGRRINQPATLRLVRAPSDPQRIESAYVLVDLDFLRDAYAALGRGESWRRDLQILLAHELYGHLVPAAASGRRADVCFDPGPLLRRRSPGARGCPTERENLVRADLGAPERASYGSMALEAEEVWRVIGRAYAAPRAVMVRPTPAGAPCPSEACNPPRAHGSSGAHP